MGGPSDPVMDHDLLAGCWIYLSGKSDLIDFLGEIPPDFTGEDPAPFLFVSDDKNDTPLKVQNSSSCAVVLSYGATWNSPNVHNSAYFPRLVVELYVDPIRTTTSNSPIPGQGTDPGEVRRRMRKLYKLVDKYLHRKSTEIVYWGDVRTQICTRLNDPEPYSWPKGDGMLYCKIYYAVSEV